MIAPQIQSSKNLFYYAACSSITVILCFIFQLESRNGSTQCGGVNTANLPDHPRNNARYR